MKFFLRILFRREKVNTYFSDRVSIDLHLYPENRVDRALQGQLEQKVDFLQEKCQSKNFIDGNLLQDEFTLNQSSLLNDQCVT